MADFTKNKDSPGFVDTVNFYLKEIITMAANFEMRGGFYESIISGDHLVKTYIADARLRYVQAVSALSDILLPYNDLDIKPKYEEYIKVLDMTAGEFLLNHEDQYKKLYKQSYLKEEVKKDSKTVKKILVKYQLSIAKKLFRELNLLLHRVDYLKSSVFGESSSDDVIEDEEEKE